MIEACFWYIATIPNINILKHCFFQAYMYDFFFTVTVNANVTD